MNTQSIQQKESKEYQKFFNTYDLILSLPLPFILSGESYRNNGRWTTLWGKIPLRLYIGVNKKISKTKQIPFHYKNNQNELFQNSYVEHFYFLDKILLQDIGFNYDIWFLAEYNNFEVEHFLTLIFLTKQILDENQNPRKLQECKLWTTNTSKIFTDLHTFFEQNKEALNFCFKNTHPHIGYLAMSIIETDAFLLFEKQENLFFKEIGKGKHYYNNWINYYLINKNFPHISSDTYNNMQKQSEEITQFSKKENLHYKNDITIWCQWIEKHFAYELSKNLQEMYLNINNGKRFFTNIESYQKIYKNLNNTQNNDDWELEKYKKLFNKHLQYTNNPKHLSIVFTKKIEILSHKFIHFNQKQIQKINEEKWLQLSLDFASDQDWFEYKGLQLEQRKTQRTYSKFCSEYKLKTFIKNKLSEEAIDYNIAIKKDDGLLLDTISNKIYLFWKKINSKEIRSQSWTIELFKILLENIWNEIENTELPSSSYSKNKNEMLGKIVLPLRKLIKNKAGKELELNCHGSLGKFSLDLKHSNIKIHFLEKMKLL